MQIENCTMDDVDEIFILYNHAAAYQTTKNVVVWPSFENALVEKEIKEKRQWKILINNEMACNWATTFSDPEIWQEKNDEPSVYIHRIATNPKFRGNNFVSLIVEWSKKYALENNKRYVRLDTLGNNTRLIEYYQKCGFKFLGFKVLTDTKNLPLHYQKEPLCCFFEIDLAE